MDKVIVITGLGGIGVACARRIGFDYKLVLGDYNLQHLCDVEKNLVDAGYNVTKVKLDVTDKDSVNEFAKIASDLGEIAAIVHTSGISPNMGTPDRIIDVNLIGTARILEAFDPYIIKGTVGILISSYSSYLGRSLTKDEEKQITFSTADQLKEQSSCWNINNSFEAYVVSKRGNHFQVTSKAVDWGNNGARIISVSPGIISTPMIKKEHESSEKMTFMIANTPAKRIGVPEDIASIVEFLISPKASFISGTDILVDGGITAVLKSGRLVG